MCEILIRLVDKTHPDPEEDRLCIKRSMVIYIGEDGHPWTYRESMQAWIASGRDVEKWPHETAIIKVPGWPVADAEALVEAQYVDDAGTPLYFVDPGDSVEHPDMPVKYRKREWYGDLDALPQPMKNDIRKNGELEVNQAQLEFYLKRIRDDAPWGTP
jgi:hypothetical protein